MGLLYHCYYLSINLKMVNIIGKLKWLKTLLFFPFAHFLFKFSPIIPKCMQQSNSLLRFQERVSCLNGPEYGPPLSLQFCRNAMFIPCPAYCFSNELVNDLFTINENIAIISPLSQASVIILYQFAIKLLGSPKMTIGIQEFGN